MRKACLVTKRTPFSLPPPRPQPNCKGTRAYKQEPNNTHTTIVSLPTVQPGTTSPSPAQARSPPGCLAAVMSARDVRNPHNPGQTEPGVAETAGGRQAEQPCGQRRLAKPASRYRARESSKQNGRRECHGHLASWGCGAHMRPTMLRVLGHVCPVGPVRLRRRYALFCSRSGRELQAWVDMARALERVAG